MEGFTSSWRSSAIACLFDIIVIIMRNRRSMIPRLSSFDFLFLTFFPGYILSAVVTLKSVKLYSAHKWIEGRPVVHFKCSGESITLLPDVKKVNVSYNFSGKEFWQLTRKRTFQWALAKNRKSYTQEELDEVRIEASNYIVDLL